MISSRVDGDGRAGPVKVAALTCNRLLAERQHVAIDLPDAERWQESGRYGGSCGMDDERLQHSQSHPAPGAGLALFVSFTSLTPDIGVVHP